MAVKLIFLLKYVFDIPEENEFRKLNGHFDIKDIEIYLIFDLPEMMKIIRNNMVIIY